MQYKPIKFEVKDISMGSREAVIAHAVYNNIDRTKDISRKGMFNKSWQEQKDSIAFYMNHDPYQAPGSVKDVFEDDQKAYTRVKLGTHTLGNDTLIMMDEGTAKWASFGYITVKSNPIEVKGQKVRELKEVVHLETSILTAWPANPQAGLVTLQKMFEQGETSVEEIKAYIETVYNFCRNTKASDECIKSLLSQSENLKTVLSRYDTVDTQLATEPTTSVEEEKQFNDNEVLMRLKLLNLKLS